MVLLLAMLYMRQVNEEPSYRAVMIMINVLTYMRELLI